MAAMMDFDRCKVVVIAALMLSATTAFAAAREGVDVGSPSVWRKLVPAHGLEESALEQYDKMKHEASAKRALAPDDHPQVIRLRAIAKRIIAHADRFNPDAAKWRWEVNLIGSRQINAFCMPGGKIAFYVGILETLKLTDDEVAMVMGHEVAHALREHARERLGKTAATRFGAAVVGSLVSNGRYADVFGAGGQLLTLKFSRSDETEADLVGMELAARAGYDPRSGISLWQKMSAANRNAPPQWMSTHPSGQSRIKDIEKHLKDVLPLYERARAAAPR
jgi:predicted Zn-dependent protease